MFSNAFTANDMYPVRDCEKLLFSIHMQLSLKRKTFSVAVVPLLESSSNFLHFETQHELHRCFMLGITD